MAPIPLPKYSETAVIAFTTFLAEERDNQREKEITENLFKKRNTTDEELMVQRLAEAVRTINRRVLF